MGRSALAEGNPGPFPDEVGPPPNPQGGDRAVWDESLQGRFLPQMDDLFFVTKDPRCLDGTPLSYVDGELGYDASVNVDPEAGRISSELLEEIQAAGHYAVGNIGEADKTPSRAQRIAGWLIGA